MRCLVFLLVCSLSWPLLAAERLDAIRARGHLNCWVSDNFPGFAERMPDGRWQGFEVDLCDVIATAILGDAGATRIVPASSVHDFLADPEADIVIRRLSWTARREAPGQLVFGPIVFHDAQGLMLDSRQVNAATALAGRRLCVSTNLSHQHALRRWAARFSPPPTFVPIDDRDAPHAWHAAQCAAWSTDLTTLLLARQRDDDPEHLQLSPILLTREPLAPLLKVDDEEFVRLTTWVLNGLIAAANDDLIELDDSLAAQLYLPVSAWAEIRKRYGDLAQIEQRHFGIDTRLPLPWMHTPGWRTQMLTPPTGPALR